MKSRNQCSRIAVGVFGATLLAAVGHAQEPQQFAAYVKSETDKWTKVIKASGLRVE